jgi:CheY-like chemotaxis protein
VVRIRALVVDDSSRMIDDVKSRLGRELPWDIVWQTTTDVGEGLRLIASSADPFDLVIADLMFYRADVLDLLDPRGLDLISDASQRSTHTFILAISTGSNYLPDLMDEAKQRGAHHVVRRNEFSITSAVHSPKAIASEIREHLLDNGTVSASEVIYNPLDPGIQGLLHQVGEPTIARLYSKILDDGGHQADRIEVRFLTPGASGASICTVTAQVDGVGRMSHILKLSQAKELLAREAERGKRAAEVLPTLLVHHRPAHSVGPVNGWYGLGGPLIERATTLREWLAGGPSPAVVSDVLEALFIDGLGQVYADGRYQPTEPLASFTFTPYRQQRILQALDELRQALARQDGGALGEDAADIAADLTAFVTEKRLPRVLAQAIPQITYICNGHGDLHGDNVLISTGLRPQPLLIDPSHFGLAHWANDPARLAVDLLMRSVDAGTESMLFTGFGTWRALASRFAAGRSDLTAVTATPPTLAALAALSWITMNLHRVSPSMQPSVAQGEHRWEWHMSLAKNLLRSTYHRDIPHAKRALAFVAAYDQLVAAAEGMPG